MLAFYLIFLFEWLAPIATLLTMLLVAWALFNSRHKPKKEWIAVCAALGGGLLCFVVWGVETTFYQIAVTHEIIAAAPSDGAAAFCKLGQGYDLQMSKDWSTAYLLHDPAWTGQGNFPERYDVTRLQIASGKIFGESRIHGKEGPYFILDTIDGTMKTFVEQTQLASAVNVTGAALQLKAAKTVYGEHRSGQIPDTLWLLLIATAAAVIIGLTTLLRFL